MLNYVWWFLMVLTLVGFDLLFCHWQVLFLVVLLLMFAWIGLMLDFLIPVFCVGWSNGAGGSVLSLMFHSYLIAMFGSDAPDCSNCCSRLVPTFLLFIVLLLAFQSFFLVLCYWFGQLFFCYFLVYDCTVLCYALTRSLFFLLI